MKKMVMHVLLVLMLCCLFVLQPVAAVPTKASITVTSPNGGEQWYQYAHLITWNYKGNPGSTVIIDCIKVQMVGGIPITTIYPISDNTQVPIGSGGKGSFKWNPVINPSEKVPVGTGYKIRIRSTNNPQIYDVSNRYFSIIPKPTITLTSPKGGEEWVRGTTHSITWGYTGKFDTGVNIDLYRWDPVQQSTTITSIAKNVPIGGSGKGSYRWIIPPKQPIGNTYSIHIKARYQPEPDNPSYWADASSYGSFFTITSGLPLP